MPHTLVHSLLGVGVCGSQHFGFVHAAGLGNISLTRQNRGLHAAHVLARGGDGHARGEVAVVHHAFPRVIPLPVLFDQRVKLFFLLRIIGAAQLDLPLPLRLPLLQRHLGGTFALALRLFLPLLLLVELGLASLFASLGLRNALQLFLGVVVIARTCCWLCGLGHEGTEGVRCILLGGESFTSRT